MCVCTECVVLVRMCSGIEANINTQTHTERKHTQTQTYPSTQRDVTYNTDTYHTVTHTGTQTSHTQTETYRGTDTVIQIHTHTSQFLPTFHEVFRGS